MSHAAIRAVEIQLKQRGNYIEGSELFHYYVARKEVNNQFPKLVGMTVRDGCKALKKYGMAIEYSWKYNVSKANVKPHQVAYVIAGLYKVSYYARLISLEQIKNSIKNDIPVVFGLRVDSNFMKLSLYNAIWTPGGSSRGGHALVITKYDDSTQRFTVDNSWGSSWGRRGQFEISYEDFEVKSFDWFKIIMR